MKKSEIKKAKDNELIVDLVETNQLWATNMYTHHATQRLEQHFHDLAEELVKRGILTQEDVKRIEGK